MDILFWGDKIQ